MKTYPLFDGSTAAVFQIDGATLSLSLHGVSFPLAANSPLPLPTETEADTGTFGPVYFALTPLVTGAPMALAIVQGNGAEGIKLEVDLDDKRRVLSLEDFANAAPGWFRLPLAGWSADRPILPGHVRAVLTAEVLALEFFSVNESFDTVRLIAAAGATARIEFNLFWKTAEGFSIGIPLGAPTGQQFAFGFGLAAEAEAQLYSWQEAGVPTGRITILENSVGWGVPAVSDAFRPVREVVGFAERALLGGSQELKSVIRKISLGHPEAVIEGGGLRLSNLSATVSLDGGRTLNLVGPGFLLDQEFHLQTEGAPRLELVLDQDALVLGGGPTQTPLSIRFLRGTKFTFCLDPRDPYIALTGGSEGPPAKVYVPGLKDTDLDPTAPAGSIEPTAEAREQKFVLKFDGDEPGVSFCRITPHGVQMRAVAEPHAIRLGTGPDPILRDVQLEHGSLTLDRGNYDLDIGASARLGFFERATGRLAVRANSGGDGGKFAARFDVQIEGAWEDPTGSLEFRDPGASVAIKLDDAKGWDVEAFISGTVRFKAVERWLSGAGEWLGDLAKDLAVRFDRLSLRELLADPLGHLSLNLQSDGGRELKLWKLLRFELTELALGRGSIVLAGKVHFSLEGGFYFMGSIPRLRISLTDGIDLMDDPGQPLTLAGKLVTPTGISAELELVREQGATRQRLAGHGSLLIPGWPGFHVTCGFGRRQPDPALDEWIPTLFLFVEADFPVTIFPCVVLREMGLGFGINQKLRGFDKLWVSDHAFDNLMKDPRGLPNPAVPADWEDGGGSDFTDVALVARTHVAPSPEGRGPFPYIADAMLYIQPTSEFTIAFTSNLWLFTGIDDVRSSAYRGAPLAQTLIVLYPRHGHLEARSRTRRDSKMSAAPDAVAKALGIVETEMQLKATPDMFRLRVGLMQVELKLLGFDLRGTFLYGVEAGHGTALMLMQQQMSGSFDLDWSFGLSLGPLSVKVGLAIHARMAYSLLLAGGYFGAELGMLFYGQARIHISVDLSVSVTLAFNLRIKIGWFKVTISWSKHLSASLAISFEAEVEALLGTSGMALRGEGTLCFSCCGFSFSPRISFSVGSCDRLDQVRARLRPLLPPGQDAL